MKRILGKVESSNIDFTLQVQPKLLNIDKAVQSFQSGAILHAYAQAIALCDSTW